MRRELPTVVITHPLFGSVVEAELKPHARVILAETPAALRRALPRADGLVTLLLTQVDDALLEHAPKLRALANVAVGLNNIDLAACARRGVRVCNTPKVLTRATAEIAVALLFAAARRLPEGEQLCRTGRFKGWAPDMLLGLELKGRNALIVGPGRIGQETARMLRALGLTTETLGRDARASEVQAKLRRAQIVSIHLPLTRETRHWLDARKLARLPRDAIVVNTSRGPTIDEKALIRALQSRRIFAAGLDVYEHEPAIPAALRRLPNVVLLPHLGSATRETREAMARAAVTGVVGILRGKRPWNEVKLPQHG